MKRLNNALNPLEYMNFAFEMQKLTMAASETIWHRSLQMTSGTMSLHENASMWTEKPTAMFSGIEKATAAAVSGKSPAKVMEAAMEPMTTKATANAKRLRK